MFYSVDREGVSMEKRIELEEEKKVAMKMLMKLSRKDSEIENDRIAYLRKLISNPKVVYYEYEEEKKRRIQKLKQARQDFVDFVRYKPNYNAIYPTVYAVKMFQPVYHKQEHSHIKHTPKLLPRHVSFIKGDIVSPVPHSKTVYENKVEKKGSECPCEEKSEERSGSKEKRRIKRYKVDPRTIKTISFEKTSGRENKIKQRRQRMDKFIGYSPNYDFIRKDTTKTCKFFLCNIDVVVHYGKDLERDFRNRKHKMSRQAMCSYDIVPEYSVEMVIEEHKKMMDEARNEADIQMQYKRALSKWQLQQIYNQKCALLPSIQKQNRNNSL